MVGRASIRPQDTDTGTLHTARPSWPGRGEKVAPHQEGGPARAPVPVLGATYAYDVSEVRTKIPLALPRRIYTANEGACSRLPRGRLPDRVADWPRRHGRRLPGGAGQARSRRGAEGHRARAARRRQRPPPVPLGGPLSGQ